MKKCPKCGAIYDPDLDFCLEDGTRLKALLTDSTDIPTKEIKAPRTLPVPMEVNTVPALGATSSNRRGAPAWVYAIIGVLAIGLFAAIGIILLLWSRNNTTVTAPNTNPNPGAVSNTANTNRVATPTSATPQPRPSSSDIDEPSPSLSGTWDGDWSGGAGGTSYFTAHAELTETNGRVEGQILWTLTKSANPTRTDKLGRTATEYVRGTFNPATRVVDIEGYRKDDPNNVIMLDHYVMSLSADRQAMNGKSKSGTIKLHR